MQQQTIETILKGSDPTHKVQNGQFRITDEGIWASTWYMYCSQGGRNYTPPVDFNTKMVVGIDATDIKISQIFKDGENYHITLSKESYGETHKQTYHFVELPKTNGHIEFNYKD